MSVRTVEDRYALLYFQTSPFSNIIGVYPLVLAIAASEMGWDVESQLKPVVKRLAEAGLVKFDEESGFIWITDWWIHNVATASIGPSLLGKSVKQIKAMPKEWQDDYLAEFIPRLNKNSRTYKQLCREFGYPDDSEVTDNADLEGSRSNVQHMAANRGVAHHDEHVDRGVAAHDDPVDRGSTPCRDSVGRSGGNTTTNSIYNPITTTTKVTHKDGLSQLSMAQASFVERLLAGIPAGDAQALLDEFAAALQSTGTILTTPTQYMAGLVKIYRKGGFEPAAGIRIAERRSIEQQQLKRQSGVLILSTAPDTEQQRVPTLKELEERAKLKTMRAEIAGRRQQGSAL